MITEPTAPDPSETVTTCPDTPAPTESAAAEELKPLSLRFAEVCDAVLAELEEELQANGGEPTADSPRLVLHASRLVVLAATRAQIPLTLVSLWEPVPRNLAAHDIGAEEAKAAQMGKNLARQLVSNMLGQPNTPALLREVSDCLLEQAQQHEAEAAAAQLPG